MKDEISAQKIEKYFLLLEQAAKCDEAAFQFKA
jgi:hypothetical protein